MILGKNPGGDIVYDWDCSSGLYGGRPGDLQYLELNNTHQICKICSKKQMTQMKCWD